MESLRERIARHEGIRRYVYDDATGEPIVKGYTVIGNPTIGIGRLACHPKGLSVEEAYALLDNDVAQAKRDLVSSLPWVTNLPAIAREVLEEMVFQMGLYGTLQFKNTIKCLERGDFNGAADSMLASKWAAQTPARACELASLIRNAAD